MVQSMFFIQGPTKRFHTVTTKHFSPKTKITMNFQGKVQERTIKFFKKFVYQKKIYCIHLKETTFDLLPTVIPALQRTLKITLTN